MQLSRPREKERAGPFEGRPVGGVAFDLLVRDGEVLDAAGGGGAFIVGVATIGD